MAISRSKKKRRAKLKELKEEAVPFVPDFNLLDRQLKLPTEHEVIAIGLALHELVSHDTAQSVWQQAGMMIERERRL